MMDDVIGEVVMSGDWYHDKIDSRIDGFFEALDYHHIPYTVNIINCNAGEDEY